MNLTIFRALLVWILLLVAAQEMLGKDCTNADLFGPYAAISEEGQIVLDPPPPAEPVRGPMVRIGRMVASGDGQFAFNYTKSSYLGKTYGGVLGGLYTVSPDCSIELDFLNVSPPVNAPVLPFLGVLADDNREAKLLATGPGTVITAALHKMTVRGCLTSDFAGPFALQMSGWIYPPSPRAGRFARVGKLVSDGQGTFLAYTLASYNALFEAETLAGTYTVDSECKMVFRYTVAEALPRIIFPNLPGATAAPPYDGVIEGLLPNRSNAVLMQTSPDGAAITGRLKKF
jgi:hypothetical protein